VYLLPVGFVVALKKTQTKNNQENQKQTKKTVTKKTWFICGLRVGPSPGLWYLGPMLTAVEAMGSLITDAAGQAGRSCAQGQAAPDLRNAQSPSSQPFRCHLPFLGDAPTSNLH